MKRGWCPSVFEPMPSGDGLVVRVKPRAGVVTAAQARILADAAGRYGNGLIEATARANLQIRGLSDATTGPFAAKMVEAGLADPDPAIERRRNIIADTPPIAAALERALAADTSLGALPAKFGFLVDSGGLLSPASAPADIWIRLKDDWCEIGIDGASRTVPAPISQAVEIALALAHAYLALATDSTPRMRSLVQDIGEAALFAPFETRSADEPSPSGRGFGQLVGRLSDDMFGIGLAFGSISALELSALAGLAERLADGTLRVTPWRVLALSGVRSPIILARALTALPLISDPADPRLTIAACPGSPACASASVDTRTLAAELAGLQRQGGVHVSGCAKGCAHPGPAATTLVGNAGRYDLIRNGAASAEPARRGLTAAEALAAL